MSEEKVILVDASDAPIGEEEKLAAHRSGKLHRAFSILVLDDRGRLLLQQRAAHKYHSRLLWSNTCCGHPRPGEPVLAAAHRRLKEEMGFDCPLERVGAFTYRAELEGGLTENEVDHVFVGRTAAEVAPAPDPNEVASWRWSSIERVVEDLQRDPTRYTAWFAAALREMQRFSSASQ